MYHTIGQRKGLNIGGPGGPWFVIGKEYDDNILYVASGDENNYLYSTSAIIENFNYLTDLRPNSCTTKFRYRQKDNDVSIHFINENTIYVTFKNPVKSVTPGQAAVFYQGDVCLGGGTIEKVYKDGKELTYL